VYQDCLRLTSDITSVAVDVVGMSNGWVCFHPDSVRNDHRLLYPDADNLPLLLGTGRFALKKEKKDDLES
jgi:hypothetical protein